MFHNCRSKEDVKSLFRRLAKYLHPDHGGDAKLMILLQEARDQAEEILDGYEEYETKHKEDREYYTVYDDIRAGDPLLSIFDEIDRYAAKNKRFDMSYTNSVWEYLEKNGYITSNQFNGLVKIYYAFRMDQFNNEN